MSRLLRYSLIPAAAALAALFAVLPATTTGRKVSMVDTAGTHRYLPPNVRIAPDGAVTFVNDSRITHTATCEECPRGFDTGDIFPGISRTIRLTVPGTYRFACRYHGAEGMAGVVVVGGVGPSP